MVERTGGWEAADWQWLRAEAEVGRRGQGAVVEASRRLSVAIDAQDRSATKLGNRIWWLNFWLLIFTIVICGLTAVLVLGELGLLKRLLG